MNNLEKLLNNNKSWAADMVKDNPQFFSSLARQQKPEYLWIGCSDSRVPANQIVNLLPGEIFVHRNIANLIQISDLNCLSVIQYAVEVLGVKHIIVCGHYGCGGVQAAIEDSAEGIIDYWVWNIKLTAKKHKDLLCDIDKEKLADVVCELNVIEQVLTLSQNRAVQDAWEKGVGLDIHGWVYGLNDGVLKDLAVSCDKSLAPLEVYQGAINKLKDRYS